MRQIPTDLESMLLTQICGALDISSKVGVLVLAMRNFEGWNADSGGGYWGNKPTVSYRNHNPLNLRYSPFQVGSRDGFAYFTNDLIGYYAACWDIMKKCKGETSTGLNGNASLAELIHVWAPTHENPTYDYIEAVVEQTGFPEDMKLHSLLV